MRHNGMPDFLGVDRERRTARKQELDARARMDAARSAEALRELDKERRAQSVAEAKAKAQENYAKAAEAIGRLEEERRRKLEEIQERSRQAKAAQAAAQAAQAGQEMQSSAVFMLTNRLNGGELSPFMHGQADRPQYQNGAFEMSNMVPMPQGGATRRPGTVWWADIFTTSYKFVRIVPFHFSNDEERLLLIKSAGEDEESVMEIYVRSGNKVLGGSRVDTSLALPFKGRHLREISFCQSADVVFYAHRSYPPGKIYRLSDTKWEHAVIEWEPDIEPPKIISVVPTGVLQKNDNQRTSYTYVATSVSAETGMESRPSKPFKIEDVGTISNSYTMTVVVSHVEGAAYYRVYREHCGVYGFVGTITEEG